MLLMILRKIYTSRPTYITHKIFGENYATIHEIKPELILNNPI